MRILIIAMSESIHTARWVSQIADEGWEIHLFPSIDSGYVHPELKKAIVYPSTSLQQEQKQYNEDKRVRGTVCRKAAHFLRKVLYKIISHQREDQLAPEDQLARLIGRINPDIIHSLEIQHAGYLTLEAKKRLSGHFPPWIVTNWGSDIYLFGRLSEHKPRIQEVLGACDYYSCECSRDVALAKEFNFMGKVLPVFPNSGGFHLDNISSLRRPGPVAARRVIMLKGYQGWAGRALVGLRALERCADILFGYTIVMYSVNLDVLIAAELFQKSSGVSLKILPSNSPHQEILGYHGQARVSLSLSISDAISTSCLEALVMGSFPIQSWTSCADEWIQDGITGILVPPEDPDVIEQAIRRALTDDELVNQAAVKNYELATKRLDQSIFKPRAIEFYTTVAEERMVPLRKK